MKPSEREISIAIAAGQALNDVHPKDEKRPAWMDVGLSTFAAALVYQLAQQGLAVRALQSGSTARDRIMAAVEQELAQAYEKHGSAPWGRHEFYAILLEEVDELWDAIKADDDSEELFGEAIQVAAMVMRYLETGNRYRGDFWEAS